MFFTPFFGSCYFLLHESFTFTGATLNPCCGCETCDLWSTLPSTKVRPYYDFLILTFNLYLIICVNLESVFSMEIAFKLFSFQHGSDNIGGCLATNPFAIKGQTGEKRPPQTEGRNIAVNWGWKNMPEYHVSLRILGRICFFFSKRGLTIDIDPWYIIYHKNLPACC